METNLSLNRNQLKILALITMTVDHIGMLLFPRVELFRIIGRIAFPIFAYMIAEGCTYTHSRGKYLLQMASLALVCQLVYFFAMGSLYMCVLVTFSLSIGLIYALDLGRSRKGIFWAVPLGMLLLVFLLTLVLPRLLTGTDYGVDYGFWGVMLPIFAYLGVSKKDKFALFSAGMILLNRSYGGIQWYALLALLPIYFYDGTGGKVKMKYLFYIYYPAHLVALHFISQIL